jgi:hypothetical protein
MDVCMCVYLMNILVPQAITLSGYDLVAIAGSTRSRAGDVILFRKRAKKAYRWPLSLFSDSVNDEWTTMVSITKGAAIRFVVVAVVLSLFVAYIVAPDILAPMKVCYYRLGYRGIY